MNEKLVKSGLAAVSTVGFLLLGSCSTTPPDDAIFNSRGGHMPPPSQARNASGNLTKPVTPVVDNTQPGLILNNTGPGAGIVIEENVTPPPIDPSFTSPAVNKMTYKVQRGDSLWKVARNHGVSMQDLARENNLSSKSQLKIGQSLTLPAGARLLQESEKTPIKSSSNSSGSQKYKVRKGDSLSVIAWKYKTSVSAIKSASGLKSDVIRVNQVLTIPNKNSARSTTGMKASTTKKSSGSFPATGNVYTVRKGDSLGVIAQKHGVKVSAIKKANGLKSDNIIAGSKLVIPGGKKLKTPKTKSPTQKRIEDEIFGNVEKKTEKKPEPEMKDDNPFADANTTPKTDDTVAVEKKPEPAAPKNVMDVLVVESDTLESLANDFNTTVELIKKANPKVKGNEDLKPGSVIKVPRGN